MRSEDVTFKTVDAQIETRDGDNVKTMDVCEITYPDGKIVAYPVDMESPESGKKYRDMFPDKYKAFKNGEGDADRVTQLQSEIKDRQAELDGLKHPKKDADAKRTDRK